jgi:hypothetical protein
MAGDGFGNAPWGGGSWGGVLSTAGGDAPENIPFTVDWDIFDLSGVRQPNDMDRVQSFVETSTIGNGASFFIASFNICSGGTAPAYPTDTAQLLIDKAVTEDFTIEWRVAFNDLPPDFSDLVNEHVYLGAWSQQDFAVGFFFSQAGIQHTGELTLTGGNIGVVQTPDDLPGSSSWIKPGVEYVIRAAVNSETQLLYLFVTPAADIDSGSPPILRAILVAKPTLLASEDNILVSVRGTATNRSCVELFNYQMSSKFLVSNLAPVALAGDDQAINRCSIVELDGTNSFDPEGEELTYEWRLIDAPQGSMFVVEGTDGVTQPKAVPTGFTDRFFSDTLGVADSVESIQDGDVVTLVDGSFTIVDKGTDSGNFYVDVEYSQIPDSYGGVAFKLLRQAGISRPTTANPTFYPDVLGFYLFDLRVNDGELSSSPLGLNRDRVLINVVESALPRGCAVDTEFMFNYMLSFWRLVEDKDRIATFFEAVSRVASSELYTLWQVEYSKSLRDIQRTFVRRWLHYDLLLPEPVPELTRVRDVWSGVTTTALPAGIIVGGKRLIVSSPRLTDPVEITLNTPGVVSPSYYALELQTVLRQAIDPSFSATSFRGRAGLESITQLASLLYPDDVQGRYITVTVDGTNVESVTIGMPVDATAFIAELVAGLPSASVTTEAGLLRIGSKTLGGSIIIDDASTLLGINAGPLIFPDSTAESPHYVRVTADVPFTFTSLSSAPGFSYPVNNTLLGGLSGQKVAERTFRADQSLSSYGLAEGDLLVVGRVAFSIVRIIDDESDDLPFQRVVVNRALSTDLDAPDDASEAPATEWIVPGWVQSEFLNFYNGLVDRGDYVDFEVVLEGQTELVETTAIGVSPSRPNRLGIDTPSLRSVLTGSETSVRLARVIRRHYVPVDARTEDIPILNDVIAIEDTDAVLRRNVDFFIEEFRGRNSVRFSTGVGAELGDVWEGDRPPDRLWAEYTFFNNEELIEANFGAAIGLTRDRVPDDVDYLSAVRGIWYALYNGPTMRNLRIALQIFLGLPFAEVAGIIREIRTDFLSQRSRILIQDADNPAIVRSYVYPRVLEVEVNPATGDKYAVGDSVDEFAPLVTGAEIVDYVKDPTWFQGITTQGIFVEPQKYHTFAVRVDSEAFNLNSLRFAQDFVNGVKPTYTDPMYLIVFRVAGDGDEIDVVDDIEMNVTLHLQDSMCDRLGASTRYDQPFPGGDEYGWNWRNKFDHNDDPTDADPSYPGPSDTVRWGYDKEYICPDDIVEAERCEEYNNEIPRYDSVLKYDVGPFQQLIDTTAGPLVFPQTFNLGAAFDGTISRIFLQLEGDTGTITEAEWQVELLVDSVVEATVPFSLGRSEYQNPGPALVFVVTLEQNVEVVATVSVPVTAGQTVELRVQPVSAAAQNPTWTAAHYAVNISQGVWQFDTPVDGTLCSLGELDPPEP